MVIGFKSFVKKTIVVIVVLAFSGCTSSVDFEQISDVEINQNLASTFVFLDLNQNKFLNADGSMEISTVSDLSIMDIFNSEYVQENLVQSDFSFNIENSFNRNFEIEFWFLNADNNSTKNISIDVPNNTNVTYNKSFTGLDLLALKFSRKLRIVIRLLPSTDSSYLDKDVLMNLNIKSYTNFIFKIN